MNGKAELRRHYRKVRLAHQREGDKIGRSVLPLIEQSISGSGHVGLFWPLSGEVDLRWLRERLPSQLGLPVADGSGGLQYRCWSDAPLQPDSCGIPAPAHGSPLGPDQLELLLVPALAVDQQGIRLGYGGGYYDRLRADPAWAAVPAWLVLPSACVTTEPLPRDPWDVPFTGWITERGAGRPA